MKINNKFYISVLFISLFIISLNPLNAADYKINIIKSDANSVELKIQFDEPQIIHGKNGNYAYYKKSSLIVNENYNLVPVVTRFISIAGKNPVISIIGSEKKTLALEQYLKISSDTIQTINTQPTAVIKYSGLYKSCDCMLCKYTPLQLIPTISHFHISKIFI